MATGSAAAPKHRIRRLRRNRDTRPDPSGVDSYRQECGLYELNGAGMH